MSKLDTVFIKRMEDLLKLYEHPDAPAPTARALGTSLAAGLPAWRSLERPLNPNEPVVCLDERPVKLHGEKRRGHHVRPGRPARYDYEYVRQGTANIFCAVEPRAGRHITKVTTKRGSSDFAKMLMQILRRYPKAKTIHLVRDNLSTHFLSSLVRHYGQRRGRALWNRFTVHYTPKHGSWLNQAEIEIGVLNRQCLGRRRIPQVDVLRSEVRFWNTRANRARQKIDWRFTRKKARRRFGYKPPAPS